MGLCESCGVQSVYTAAGGEAGLRRLAASWHQLVMADEIVSHAFHGGARPDHTERLAAYWGESLGGPPTYTQRYGAERDVVRRHAGNGPHEEMDRRANECFDRAVVDAGLGEDERLCNVLHDYFAWATQSTMTRTFEEAERLPGDVRIPRWSWEGLVSDESGQPPS
jgi:hemoglobin